MNIISTGYTINQKQNVLIVEEEIMKIIQSNPQNYQNGVKFNSMKSDLLNTLKL